MIFDLVREENGENQMIGGISKALLPYTRSNLYRKIHLAKWKQLRRLTAALERDEELGDLVNELSVAITSTAENIEEKETLEDEDQPEVVESLLFALNSLETLTTSTPLVTEVVLDEYFAECGLPSLFSLSIEDSFDDFSDPYSTTSLSIFTLASLTSDSTSSEILAQLLLLPSLIPRSPSLT